MGFWQDITGKTGADAAKAAAADQYAKQQAAVGNLLNNGANYKAGMDQLYAPYAATGAQANNMYWQLLSDPSSVSSLPGYQFTMDQGTNAIDRSAVSKGTLNSGSTLKALDRFGQGTADSFYQNFLNDAKGGVQIGQYGTSGQAQGLQGQLNTDNSAYGDAFTSAGTIGQGNVAAASDLAKGSQSLLNTGLSLGGMALGGFGGLGGLSGLMGLNASQLAAPSLLGSGEYVGSLGYSPYAD